MQEQSQWLGSLGWLCQDQERSAEAADFLLRAAELAREFGDLDLEAKWLAVFGSLPRETDEDGAALVSLQQSASIARKLSDFEMEGIGWAQVSEHFRRQGDAQAADRFAIKALEHARRHNLTKLEAGMHGQRGLIFSDLDDFKW